MFKSILSLLLAVMMSIIIVTLSTAILAVEIDPTRPFGAGITGSNESVELKRENTFKLTSIIHGDNIHTAVINGKIYKMFDYVGEYRITAINSHSVILRSESKRLKIDVFKSKGFKSNIVESVVAN